MQPEAVLWRCTVAVTGWNLLVGVEAIAVRSVEEESHTARCHIQLYALQFPRLRRFRRRHHRSTTEGAMSCLAMQLLSTRPTTQHSSADRSNPLQGSGQVPPPAPLHTMIPGEKTGARSPRRQPSPPGGGGGGEGGGGKGGGRGGGT